jgi:hypothetical protein
LKVRFLQWRPTKSKPQLDPHYPFPGLPSDSDKKLRHNNIRKKASPDEIGDSQRKKIFGAGFALLVTSCLLAWDYSLWQEHELSLNAGVLTPDDLPDPANPCDAKIGNVSLKPDTALQIQRGREMVFYSTFPHEVFRVNGQHPLLLDRDKDGRIAITFDVYDRADHIVAEFNEGSESSDPFSRTKT